MFANDDRHLRDIMIVRGARIRPGRELARSVPGAEFVVLQDAGELIEIEKPAWHFHGFHDGARAGVAAYAGA